MTLSHNAGRFVCNWTYYHSLSRCRTRAPNGERVGHCVRCVWDDVERRSTLVTPDTRMHTGLRLPARAALRRHSL